VRTILICTLLALAALAVPLVAVQAAQTSQSVARVPVKTRTYEDGSVTKVIRLPVAPSSGRYTGHLGYNPTTRQLIIQIGYCPNGKYCSK
jgi:hypothetical protein